MADIIAGTEPIETVATEEPARRTPWGAIVAAALLVLVAVGVGVWVVRRDDGSGSGSPFSLEQAATNAANAPGSKVLVTSHVATGRVSDGEIDNKTGVVHAVMYHPGEPGAIGSMEVIVDTKAGVMYLSILGTEMKTKAGAPIEKWLQLDQKTEAAAAAATGGASTFDLLDLGSTARPAALVGKATSVKDLGFDEVEGETVKHYAVTVPAAEAAKLDKNLQQHFDDVGDMPADMVYDMYVTEQNEIRRVAFEALLQFGTIKAEAVLHLLTESPGIEMPAAKDVTPMSDTAP